MLINALRVPYELCLSTTTQIISDRIDFNTDIDYVECRKHFFTCDAILA